MNPDPSAAFGTRADARTVMSSAPSEDRLVQTVTGGVANPDAHMPYEFRQEIARGGMGSILEAVDRKLGRTVAVKVMLSEMGADAEQRQRFINEAAVLAWLAHPNIVPVYDIGRDEGGQLFYTMKLVHGRTLQAILNGVRDGVAEARHYTLDRLLTIFCKVCDALAFAHSRGIIHRDMKPENVMVGEFGEVLVMDWGLAKQMRNAECGMRSEDAGTPVHENSALPAADPDETVLMSGGGRDALRRFLAQKAGGDAGMTLEGEIMGTPQYMSPEQEQGRIAEMDARSDIFSLGGILYAILTLRPPVEGATLDEVLGKVASGSITPPSAFGTVAGNGARGAKGEVLEARKIKPLPHCPGGRVPAALSTVVMKALTVDKAKRYQTVAAFSADIEAYQNGFATSAENAGVWRLFKLFIKRHKAASVGVAAVLLIGSTLGTKAIVEGKRAERGEALAQSEAVRAQRGEAKANAALADLKASAPSLLALAESEAGFQRFDSALVKLDAALALDPALTAGWWRRTWLLLGMARYGEAAAAFRTAQQRDPAQHAHDALLPVLDAIAAAPDDATRFPPERTDALFRHFTKVGASGELNALSRRLTLGATQKEQMVRKRLDEWLGKNVGKVVVQPDGTIKVEGLPKATDTLEPLRGLPIGSINLDGTAVKSLEPLRGMALTTLYIANTRISDLSPLRGMPITELTAENSDISDLSPLAAMPLRHFYVSGHKISDISPLRGAPLEEFKVTANRIVDFSPLRGAPLKKVIINQNPCSDLSFLTDSPALEYLDSAQASIADLSPLRGKPLKFLSVLANRITDLRPLAGLPLAELFIDNNPIADYAPLRELRQLQKLRISELKFIKVPLEPLRQHPSLQYIAAGGGSAPYRPVVEFWADYDVQQAAGKK